MLEAWERVDWRVCRRAASFGVCLRPEARPSSLSHGIFPSSSAGPSHQNTSQARYRSEFHSHRFHDGLKPPISLCRAFDNET